MCTLIYALVIPTVANANVYATHSEYVIRISRYLNASILQGTTNSGFGRVRLISSASAFWLYPVHLLYTSIVRVQMNYQTMADIFKGLAQTGAWGCEYNNYYYQERTRSEV